jgi:predicted site-specific integrase-resolvase
MPDYLTLSDLAARVGRAPYTLREHIHNGWLKAEKIPGAKGWRVPAREARRYAGKYHGKVLA